MTAIDFFIPNRLCFRCTLFVIFIFSFSFPDTIVASKTATSANDRQSMIQGWIRTVTSAIAPIQSVSKESIDLIQVKQSGPLSAVFRATLSNLLSSKEPCKNYTNNYCQVGANSFGSVGQTYYSFNNSQNNLQGNSVQVILSCRCIDPSCERAILIRPVNVLTQDRDGQEIPTNRTIYLYQATGGKFTNCYSELFNTSAPTEESSFSNFTSSTKRDVHSVFDPFHKDYWTAIKYLGLEFGCLDSEIENLPIVDLNSLTASNITAIKEKILPSPPGCRPPQGLQYYRAASENDEETVAGLYNTAITSAKNLASQQDCFAVGKRPIAYMQPRSVELITNTELALTCSSGILGILLLWALLWKLMRKKKKYDRIVIAGILFQVLLSYALEALPIHTALANEISAKNWYTPLAFVDATYAYKDTDGKIDGVLMFIVIIGEARFLHTRVTLIASLTALFNFVAIGIVSLIILHVLRITRQLNKTTDSTNSTKDGSESTGSDQDILIQK